MSRSTPDADAGFATTLAMAVSLAIAMGATAVLVRSQVELVSARRALERTRAEYRLDALQMIAAREFRADQDGLKLHRVSFSEADANVQAEAEAAKLLPQYASTLPDGWYSELGVASPAAVKLALVQNFKTRPLTLQALADLDPSPLWKACAATAISANGSLPGAAGAAQAGETTSSGFNRVLRLTAKADDGWIDDRVVRLTSDVQNPVVILDRRFYRRRGEAPFCPAPPSPQRVS